jgi:putative FmdB family regulatory protein
MPIYIYKCNKCGEKFENLRAISASDDDVICPGCGEKKPQRLISTVISCGSSGSKGNLRFPT